MTACVLHLPMDHFKNMLMNIKAFQSSLEKKTLLSFAVHRIPTWWQKLVTWCFEPRQPQRSISGLMVTQCQIWSSESPRYLKLLTILTSWLSMETGLGVCLPFPPPRTNSLVLGYIQPKKANLKQQISASVWRQCWQRESSSLKRSTRAMSSANLIRVRTGFLRKMLFVWMEKRTAERTHPLGTPVFNVSSPKNTGSLHRPFLPSVLNFLFQKSPSRTKKVTCNRPMNNKYLTICVSLWCNTRCLPVIKSKSIIR